MVIETCPKCGGDLISYVLTSYPPIPGKKCTKCEWRWQGEVEEIKRVPFIPPTVPIVVVRCKDCKHSYEDLFWRVCSYGVTVDCIVPDNFFCAYGAKMDEKEEQTF